MPRPAGVRNQDFDEKRLALIKKLTAFLLQEDVDRPSFRQLAIAAKVSEPTLRHYFNDRSGLLVSVLNHLYKQSEQYREWLRHPQDSSEDAIKGYLSFTRQLAKSDRYLRVHALGIREGMSDPAVQKIYVEKFVSSGVEAIAERLLRSKGGPETYPEAYDAAFMLFSSSFALILHQELLNGRTFRPIDSEAYLAKVGNWMLNGLDYSQE